MISTLRHPGYTAKVDEWNKWRLVMLGGNAYTEAYMKKYSNREDGDDFCRRKENAPNPAFAKSCLLEIRNAIFQRLADVSRVGGSKRFQDCVKGLDFGVDLHSTSMNQYLGIHILPELLSMAKVGIYVDAPPAEGVSLADTAHVRPYYYMYKVEDILSWKYHKDRPDEFSDLTLRDHTEVTDTETGLPCDKVERVRRMWLDPDDGYLRIEWIRYYAPVYNQAGSEIEPAREEKQNLEGVVTDEPLIVKIKYIPFVCGELSDSLIGDTANHQIALLNLDSSDISYILKAGHPFYVEQIDARIQSSHLKKPSVGDDGKGIQGITSNETEISVGASQGRFYDKGLDQPAFIHPSKEPIEASMSKQEQLKNDIRVLMHLSLSNVKSKMASEGSKEIDNQGLDSGLAAIGLVLEYMERKCAFYWSLYEGTNEVPTINYPQKYSLKTDSESREEAKSWAEMRDLIPSQLFQRKINVQIAVALLATKVSQDDLDSIIKEIMSAPTVTATPKTLFEAVDAGVATTDLVADILGFPKGTAEKAREQKAETLAMTMAAQSAANADAGSSNGARGLPGDPQSGKDEKKLASDSIINAEPGAGRGEGKDNKK
jgi:hypothetical protein